MGKYDNVFTPAPERVLLPVSELEVTRRAETILVTDNSYFEGLKLFVIR